MISSSRQAPRVTIRRAAGLFEADPEEQFCDDFPLSGEHMKRAMKLIGDGKAKVSVGTDMGEKDYGNGFSVFVGVELTCNQDEKTIIKTHELGWEIAKECLEGQWAEAKELYEFLAGN